MRRLLPHLRRHLETRSRGQSMVEFALILPVFMLFFAAVLDLGRIAAAQLTVTNAAREGAFQASQTPNSYNAGQPCPADGLSNLVVCRTILEAKNSVVTVQPADIALTCATTCTSGLGNRLTVKVTGHFTLLTPLMAAFFGGSQNVTFSASSTNQIETLPTTPPTATAAPTATPTPNPSPTASPSPTATPLSCTTPSAGFIYTASPPSMQAPVTILVTDTSTSSPSCPIGSWLWNWGDGTTSSGKVPGTHTYVAAGNWDITLTVTSAGGPNTSGKVTIRVK